MKLLTILLGIFAMSQVRAESFSPCKDADAFDELNGSVCTTVSVPLNHGEESERKLTLFVRKIPAQTKPTGTLWLIAGGPGESGASFYPLINSFQKNFPGLDILIPDHRGTGASSVICPGENIDSVAGGTLVGEEWGQCFSSMFSDRAYVQSFTITNAANDLNYLITSLSGAGKKYVYGVSYGTQLVLRAMQISSEGIEGVILDSLVPVQDDKDYELGMRSHVVNDVGKTFLSEYARTKGLTGEQQKALIQNLTAAKEKYPTLKSVSDELPGTNMTNVLGAILDVPHVRNSLPELVEQLVKGNSEPFVAAIKGMGDYYAGFNPGYFNYGSSIPLVQVISVSENNLRVEKTKEELEKEEQSLLFTSPLPQLMAGNSMPTYEKDAYYAGFPAKMPDTLVISGTLDPKTHIGGVERHVKQLRKSGKISLVSITHGPHFMALNAPECFSKHAEKFIQGTMKVADVCSDPVSLIK